MDRCRSSLPFRWGIVGRFRTCFGRFVRIAVAGCPHSNLVVVAAAAAGIRIVADSCLVEVGCVAAEGGASRGHVSMKRIIADNHISILVRWKKLHPGQKGVHCK